MAQLTVRLEDRAAEDLRAEAARRGTSVNALVVAALRALVDPEHEDGAADQLRARLRRAGLLREPSGEEGTGAPEPGDDVALPPGVLAADYVVRGR